jgi:hypothetical protein
MELVPLACAVSHHNRMETDILEALQTQSAGHLGVEAAVAELSVTLVDRTVVHDIVCRDGRTARIAADHPAALLTFVSHVISSDLVSAREHCCSQELAWRMLILVAKPYLNAYLLASLNVMYKIDYLFNPSTAGTIKAVSVARVVVFAIVRGETVPLCRCISMRQIYMQPTFD